jgi:hypothetical protein
LANNIGASDMQLVANVSIPVPHHEQKYVLLPEDLKRLKDLKLSSAGWFVYLALMMSYKTSNPVVDIPTFAEAWDISEVDCRAVIAVLQKKHCLDQPHRQLELELYTPTEAIANIEEAKHAEKEERTRRVS